MENSNPGSRRIDAAEANRLASELDDVPYEAVPVDDDSTIGTVPDASSSVLRENAAATSNALFPPDEDAGDTVGGDADEQAAFQNEFSN